MTLFISFLKILTHMIVLGSELTFDPEDYGCCDADSGHKGVGTSDVAGVDASPVFQASEHDLDFLELALEHGVLRDMDIAVRF
jgi:hypothetical protein